MRFQNQIAFAVLSSTNSYLKEHYQKLPNYSVVIAGHQTAGRGRMGRAWIDGDDLLLSILIKDRLNPLKIPKLALVAAASVWKTLSVYLAVKIKWPNDIVYLDKKVAGILIESRIETNQTVALIIGIGINANTKTFPEELSQKASSLFLETKKELSIEKLKTELLMNLDYFYENFLDSGNEFLLLCRLYSSLLGRTVIVDNFQNKTKARVIDILEDGNILLEIEGVRRVYSSGEITLQEYYSNEY
ncbi:MAG: biotin--[acetyl-CoA-carboxylase] ligase [Bacilli bacterium]|nr:biotin--[acetyl-CoA-carboxylase] ligase [Bacilli bacterium]